MLKSAFEINDLEELRYFLGMEVLKTDQGLVMNQKKYTQELLEEIGMGKANPAKTPMEANLKLSHEKGKLITERNSFQRLIGKFIYISAT